MKNKFIGLAVIAAISFAALLLTGCGDNGNGGEDPDLSGDITISSNSDVVTGTVLTAVYNGNETITSYQWKRNGSAISGANSNKYTPAEVGSYTVTVGAPGYQSKTSDPVTVGDNSSVFTRIDDFATWLSAQLNTTTLNAYTVALNVDSLGGDSETFGSLGHMLRGANSNKYVYLDLSGSTITSIEDAAFSECHTLTGITIPDSVISIGDRAFYEPSSYNFSNLTSVIIGSGVKSIGDSAFANCKRLTSVIIPDSVTSIGGRAFLGCNSLTSITIPSSVTSIGGGAFPSILTYITIKTDKVTNTRDFNWLDRFSGTGLNVTFEDVTSISDYAFYDSSPYATRLTNVTISDSVTSIGNHAFEWCGGLTSVTIGNRVISIGNSAFKDCGGFTSVTIPDNVKSIEENAFLSCHKLVSVTIGRGVTSIGLSAFGDCPVTSVTFQGTIPYSSGFGNSHAFDGDLYYRFYELDSDNGTPGRYTRENRYSTTWTLQSE